MIESYRKGWVPYKTTQEEYISSTTVANTIEEVKSKIIDYINDNIESNSVLKFLEKVLFDEDLLAKVNVVWDGSYRNVSWLVRPDGVGYTGHYDYSKEIGNNPSFDEIYKYFKENAETVFIILDEQPSVERIAEWELDFEMLNDYYEEMDYEYSE